MVPPEAHYRSSEADSEDFAGTVEEEEEEEEDGDEKGVRPTTKRRKNRGKRSISQSLARENASAGQSCALERVHVGERCACKWPVYVCIATECGCTCDLRGFRLHSLYARVQDVPKDWSNSRST